jgi:hypothetical protein
MHCQLKLVELGDKVSRSSSIVFHSFTFRTTARVSRADAESDNGPV